MGLSNHPDVHHARNRRRVHGIGSRSRSPSRIKWVERFQRLDRCRDLRRFIGVERLVRFNGFARQDPTSRIARVTWFQRFERFNWFRWIVRLERFQWFERIPPRLLLVWAHSSLAEK